MISLVLLSMASFDVVFLGGMVISDDEKFMCSGLAKSVARDALMAIIS